MISFKIESTAVAIRNRLLYFAHDFSFQSDPHVEEIDFELVINDLSLSVKDKVIVEVSGFSHYKTWLPTILAPPTHVKGMLEVVIDGQSGSAFRYNNDKRWPEFVNKAKGWVCLGEPNVRGNAVEFMKNSIAVLDSAKLIALWLRPESLPYDVNSLRLVDGIT